MPLTNAERRGRPGGGGQAARSSRRRSRSARRSTLGDYRNFNVRARDRDDRRRQGRQRHRGAARPERDARARSRTDRPQKGDYAVIGFAGTRDGEPFEGGSTERMPLIIGEERLIPGFEDHLVGLTVGRLDRASTSPSRPTTSRRRWPASRPISRSTCKELREKVLPDADDEFARSMGDYADLADAPGRRSASGSSATPSTGPATGSADRIIDYAVANATLELPDILVDQEVEVMHDEFRSDARPPGHHRGGLPEGHRARPRRTSTPSSGRGPRSGSRTLLVLSKIAEVEGVDVSDADVEAEVDHGPPSATPSDPKTLALLRVASAAGTSSAARSAGRDRREARRRLAGRPSRPPAAARTSRTTRPRRRRGPGRASVAAVDATDPGCHPGPRPIRDADRRRRRPPSTSRAAEPRLPTPTARPQHRGEPTMLVPMVIESSQPRRARLRHLLAAAPGADHLPRRRDRGPRRQPDHRPAPVPRVRGPGEGHQPVHQLARRRGDERARDLRHDAVPPRAGQHDLHRHGGLDGGRPAGGRRQGQALRPAEQPDHDPPGLGRVPRQRAGRDHPDEGVGVPRPASTTRSSPSTPASRSRRSSRTPTGTISCAPERGQGLWHHRRGLLG